MPQYSKSKIYKLQCEDGYFYIGSTCNELRYRLNGHKTLAKTKPHIRVYTHINTLGWDKAQIVLVEEYCCENKEQLTRKEDEHIRIHKNDPLCLNTNRAYTTDEEKQEYHAKYREENRDLINQNAQAYRETRREKAREYARQYREPRREKAREYARQYRELTSS